MISKRVTGVHSPGRLRGRMPGALPSCGTLEDGDVPRRIDEDEEEPMSRRNRRSSFDLGEAIFRYTAYAVFLAYFTTW